MPKPKTEREASSKTYAQSLETHLSGKGAIYTSTAVTELYKVEPNFKKDLGKMKFGDSLKLLPEFEIQTSAAGGTSRVRLRS